MARVSATANYTNPVKSITFIPDHYVNISIQSNATADGKLKAGQVIKVDLTTLKQVTMGASDGNAIVFADQKVHANEGTPVTVLIHGFVNKAKLINPTALSTSNSQITVLGNTTL